MKNLAKLLLTASAFAYAMPVVTADVAGMNAAEARSEKANGGNSGNNGNGGNSGNSNGNSGTRGNSANAGSSSNKPLAASLKSLNSLGRNINGIMNSSDPKMVPVKTYLAAVAANEDAEDVAATAAEAYAASYATLAASASKLGLSDDPASWASDIAALRSTLDANPVAEGEEGYDEYLAQLADLEDAEAALAKALADKAVQDAALAEVAATEGAASEEALIDAIVAAYNATGNGPITADDVTPEMIEYAKAKLDV